uniref:Fe2OG dioxygenase domain-containing protein n=1 Tax=Kalanchoe fedtschenkoi TaxID=63787 RepID=A0A7N0SYF4_KALFE
MSMVNPDRAPAPAKAPAPENFARDAIIAWFRGEFAAANAIIDALCGHIAQLEQRGAAEEQSEYDSVFEAIHRRRMNWIPILQMQKYHSIADVTIELKRVKDRKMMKTAEAIEPVSNPESNNLIEDAKEEILADEQVAVDGAAEYDDSPDSDITDGGSQVHENAEICENHEECEERQAKIKLTKGFIAKEVVNGHKVNVVRGLKMYEDIFTDNELGKLSDFVTELRIAGQNGELPGETFKIFNQQMKGNKRELIQFGEPIFRLMKDETTKNRIGQIPPLFENVIDHLIQWSLIPSRRPNSVVINFFDEGEYSQPYLKPPHVDQPITSLCLSESIMAFGCTLVSDNEGNYKAPQMLSLKEGSLLVMRGNCADTAAHAMCPSPTKRAVITFFRVRSEPNQNTVTAPHSDTTVTVWQPGTPSNLYPLPNGGINCYTSMDGMPRWGVLPAPMVMLTPATSMLLNNRRTQQGGTGVFLPCNANSRKHTKHLPPRAQRSRLLALPSPPETRGAEPIAA